MIIAPVGDSLGPEPGQAIRAAAISFNLDAAVGPIVNTRAKSAVRGRVFRAHARPMYDAVAMKTRNKRELERYWHEQAAKKAKLAKRQTATPSKDDNQANAPVDKQTTGQK